MRKKNRSQDHPAPAASNPPRSRLRVDAVEEAPLPRVDPSLPWNATAGGVLRRALEEHGKQPYEELLIIGLRGGSVPEIYKFTKDTLRLIGIMEWAKGVLLTRGRQ